MNRNRLLLSAALTTFWMMGAAACNALVGNDSVSLWNPDGGSHSNGAHGDDGAAVSVTVDGTIDSPAADPSDASPLGSDSGLDVLVAAVADASEDGSRDAETAAEAGCPSSICSQSGTACQGAQTLVTCAADAGCAYVASMSTCPAPQSCSGLAPGAACSLTCTDSCIQGQTACDSASGGLETCTRGSNGCLAYGAPVTCPTRQVCSGSAGSAACSCKADAVCSATGVACAAPTQQVTCAQDTNGCFYETSPTTCMTGGTCQTGGCACTGGTTLCGSACADLGSNGLNCRACGRSCQGGGCSGGICQPATLASGQTPTSIAVDASYVYWTNSDGSVDKVPLAGGTPLVMSPAAGAGLAGQYITVNSSNAFWWAQSNDRIQQIGLTGGTASNFTGNAYSPQYLQADSANVYFYSSGGDGCTSAGGWGFYAAPLNGGAANLLTGVSVVGFQIQASTAYIAGGVSCRATGHGAVIGVPIAGASVTTLAAESTNSGGTYALETWGPLALSNGKIFWFVTPSGSTSSTLYSIPVTGSSNWNIVASAGNVNYGVVADGTNLYWPQGSSIMTVSVGGGAPTIFASAQAPDGIAEDATTVYFIDSTAGTVEKVVK